jgi:BMFP domain-containing protein YqiC
MMKQRSTIISDISQMAKGAASIVDDMRSDVKNMMNSREERSQNNTNLVTYEDFEALTTRLESLASRITFLEALIEDKKSPKSPAPAKKSAKRKTE